VGIGTTSPSQKLYVVGNTIIGTNNLDSVLDGEGYFQSNSPLAGAGYLATPWVYARAIEGDQRGSGTTLITIGGQNGFTNSDEIGFVTQGKIRMSLESNGNFGIGTTTPSDKLTVKGTVKAQEVIVDENAGADFVFDKNYSLPSLNKIEASIKRNNHLPGIPSADEMKKNGVRVGKLQMKLLKKIEELTLYTIQLAKENTEQQHLIQQQANMIKKLNGKLSKPVKRN
jgi:hypothetical protein